MASSKQTQIAEARRQYTAVKKLYSSAGKKARGKPKASKPYREYKEVKKAYHQIGSHLGRLTGRKSKK